MGALPGLEAEAERDGERQAPQSGQRAEMHLRKMHLRKVHLRKRSLCFDRTGRSFRKSWLSRVEGAASRAGRGEYKMGWAGMKS